VEREAGDCLIPTVGLEEVAVGVPDNVVGMIERERDRLTSLERAVLEAGRAAGMEFSTAAVATAVEEDTVRVEEVCTQLARCGQFLQLKGERSGQTER
jgi:hypothetical protein